MTKLIDCFIFYNELDLLKYRFNLLNHVVDYFVIVESTHTFTGKTKKLFFNDHKHLFKKFNDKIIHIIVKDFPFKNTLTPKNVWKNEIFQRNAIARGINDLHLNMEDMIIISDIDEIPDPTTLFYIKYSTIKNIFSLQMDFYYYNLNTKIVSPWMLCKILSYKKYKELNKTCNDIRKMKCNIIKPGGWHLSYFGNFDFIKNKIQNFSHQELNTKKNTNVTNIEKKIKNFEDLFDRKMKMQQIHINNNTYLPPLYNKYLTKFYTKNKTLKNKKK